MHEKPNLCYTTTMIPYSKRKFKYRMTILYRKAPSVFFGRSNHIFQYIKIQLKKTKFKLALSGKKASNNTKKKKKKKSFISTFRASTSYPMVDTSSWIREILAWKKLRAIALKLIRPKLDLTERKFNDKLTWNPK